MINRLIFFGNERLATATTTSAPLLRALVENGYKVEAVITSHIDPVSRQARDLEIGKIAHQHKIPVLLIGSGERLEEKISKHSSDFGVLAAFGKFIPQSAIDLFPVGIVNLHPSLLPALRGPTPIESAILNGLDKTGVSIMKLSNKMDAGPIYAQSSLKLSGDESKQELADKLSELGSELLIEHLPDILSGRLKPKKQTEKAATYSNLIQKSDGVIDWHKPIAQIEREIRAYLGWPGSRTKIFGKEVLITKAHSVPITTPNTKLGDIEVIKDGGLLMIYGQDGYICIDKLKPVGKNEMSTDEFIRGYYKG